MKEVSRSNLRTFVTLKELSTSWISAWLILLSSTALPHVLSMSVALCWNKRLLFHYIWYQIITSLSICCLQLLWSKYSQRNPLAFFVQQICNSTTIRFGASP